MPNNRKLSESNLKLRRVQAGERIAHHFDHEGVFLQVVAGITRWDDQPGSTNEVRSLRASVTNIENTRKVTGDDYSNIWALLPVIWAMTPDCQLPRSALKPDGICPPWYEAFLKEFDDAVEFKPRRYIFYHNARSHTPGGKAIHPVEKLQELVSAAAPSNAIDPSTVEKLPKPKRRPKQQPAGYGSPVVDLNSDDENALELQEEENMQSRKKRPRMTDALPAGLVPTEPAPSNAQAFDAQAFDNAAPSMSYLRDQMPALPSVSAPTTPTKQQFDTMQSAPVTPNKRPFDAMTDQPSSSPVSQSPYVSRDKYNAKSKEALKWYEQSKVLSEQVKGAKALSDLTSNRANELQRQVNDLQAEIRRLNSEGSDAQLRKQLDTAKKQRSAMITCGTTWADDMIKIRDLNNAVAHQFKSLNDEMAKLLDEQVMRGNIFVQRRAESQQTAQPTVQSATQPPQQSIQSAVEPPQDPQAPVDQQHAVQKGPTEDEIDDDMSDPLDALEDNS